jgi:hypothetical protein
MHHSKGAPESGAQTQSGDESDNIPRLSFAELEPTLAGTLEPRYRRLGYLGEFFRCMGDQPAALRAFVEFTETAKGADHSMAIHSSSATAKASRPAIPPAAQSLQNVSMKDTTSAPLRTPP